MRRLILAAAVLSLSACGGSPSGPAPRERDAVIVTADAAPGSVAEANWLRFVANVGVWAPEFSIDLRSGETAGTPAQRAAAVQAGSAQVAQLPPEAAEALVPELAVVSLPGLFASQDEADHVLDTVLLDALRPLFSARGLRLLDWAAEGWEDPATRRIYRADVIVANRDWYDRLTPHDRDVFGQAYRSAGQARADSRAAAPSVPGIEAGQPVAAATGEAPPGEADAGDPVARFVAAGPGSRQVYELVLQGRQAFATQRGAAR